MTRPDATCDWCHPPIAATSQRTICSTCLNAVNAGTYQPPIHSAQLTLVRTFRIPREQRADGVLHTTTNYTRETTR
jgi:hypothetical protein